MRGAVIIMIALLGPAAAMAATQFETVTYEITAGAGSVIGEHARWNVLCRALDAPLVTIERAARHGSICVRHDLITSIQTRSGRAANCIGRQLNGVIVVYQPRPGFAGTDTLRYGLEFPEGRVSREIAVDVRPRTSQTPDFFIDAPATVLRAGDRIPECAGESS